jgi:hypothetical protein
MLCFRYSVEFDFRQHCDNSVENVPSGTSLYAPGMQFSLFIVENFDRHQLSTVAELSLGAPVAVARDSDSDMHVCSESRHIVLPFSITSTCINCVVLIQIATNSWVSYWGNTYYVRGVTVSRALSEAIPEREFATNEHERVTLPVSPPVLLTPRAECPHARLGLKPWHDASTWGAEGKKSLCC